MSEKSEFIPPIEDENSNEFKKGNRVRIVKYIDPNDDVLVWLPTKSPDKTPQQHKKLTYRDYIGQEAKIVNKGKYHDTVEIKTIATRTHPSIYLELLLDFLEKVKPKNK